MLAAVLLCFGFPWSPAQAVAQHDVQAISSASRGGSPVIEWLPSRGRECVRRGRYRGFCQGPRRAPKPHGAAAELAERLGLGTLKTTGQLLLDPALPEWIAAAGPLTDEPLLWPVEGGVLWRGVGRVRRVKGGRRRGHRGVDIGADVGTPIRAARSGLVAYSNNEVRGYGNLLVTVHPDGSVAFYAHCRALYVFAGQRIKRGQVIAEVGQTGVARGPHLHFEYREAGRVRDPLPHFAERPD